MERVGGDQGLQLADHLAVPPGRQLGVGHRLEAVSRSASRRITSGSTRRPRRGPGRAVPARTAVPRAGAPPPAGCRPDPGPPARRRRAPRNGRRRRRTGEGEAVAARAGLQPLVSPSSVSRRRRWRRGCAGSPPRRGWRVTPEPGDEEGRRHRPVAMEDQEGEQGALLAARDAWAVGRDDLERAEDVHPPRGGHAESPGIVERGRRAHGWAAPPHRGTIRSVPPPGHGSGRIGGPGPLRCLPRPRAPVLEFPG